MDINNIWDSLKDEFVFDGSLKDLFIFQTDINDWKKIIDFINLKFKTIYNFDKKKCDSFILSKDIFSCSRYNLNFYLNDNILMSCNFYDESEFQVTIDPREINSENDFLEIIKFMKEISYLTNKNSILSEENTINYRIIEYKYKDKVFITRNGDFLS
ncbi:hypothetical protein GCL60_04105 [Silvanigrella paludirubra]|uniref:Uncharacterized protein n=1 Tax=Silvanigrella paludirubra TaxID=2499159 RepID=A0A6N6VUB1_9BACT|nr:hypothetical protein [Silvanigrella paludirubra]KAB8039444.1 hypothetical protein GCL60_04105 [Silvanigrella paludirubra]